MQLTCPTDALLRALEQADRARNPRSAVAAEQHFKLTVGEDRAVHLTARHGSVGLRVRIPAAEARRPGAVVLPGTRTRDLVRLLAARGVAAVELEVAGSNAHFREPASTTTLLTVAAEAFADVVPRPSPTRTVVPASAFRSLVARTLFAADEVTLQYAMGGALVELSESDTGWPRLALVAADMRRVAIQWTPAAEEEVATAVAGEPVVPALTLELVRRSLPADETPLEIVLPDAATVQFATADVLIESTLLAGRFPPYRRILGVAAPEAARLALRATELRRAVRVASSVLDSDAQSRGLTFTVEPDRLVLSGGQGRQRSRVEVDARHAGPALTVHLDADFVTDALKAFGDQDEVEFELAAAGYPARVRAGEFQYLLAPIDPPAE